MSNSKKISIIIPNYNSGKLLRDCIKSIHASNQRDIEIIIIDDGSNDKSAELITNTNVRIIKNSKNHGVSYSRNKGINEARGEYILFIDADDMLKDINLASLCLKENRGYEIIYYSKNKLSNDKDILVKQILGTNKDGLCIAGPYSKLFKKEFLKNNDIKFNNDVINGEDMLFNIEALSKAKKFKTINRGMYLYRKNNNSATRSYDRRLLESDKKFREYLKRLLPNKYDDDIGFLAINGLFTIIARMSFLPSKKAIKEYKSIDAEYYLQFKKSTKSLPAFKKLIINLFYDRRYRAIYCLLSIREAVSNILKKDKGFTEI